ncbi:MAG: helix-turn-helix transcriptional regulator [Bryobacteraceae bacterium]
MDLALFIKSRLAELGLEQKDLAASAQVTESYISQLLARKKVPPSAGRTEIYARMSRFLKLPEGELSKLADLQRRERLKKIVSEQLKPLHAQCRELLLAKCASGRRKEVRVIFERESFGELERLITQKFLAVAKTIVKDQLGDEGQLRLMAESSGRSPEQSRAERRAFLNSEPFNISDEICASFLASLIELWDIDLKTFGIDLIPNRKLITGGRKRFEFVETEPERPIILEPGLQEFLADATLSGDATEGELAFLRTLNFNGRRPTRIFYYRQLQNLRDPLNFGEPLQLRSSTQKKG